MAYWRDHYSSPQHAVHVARMAARGRVHLSPAQRHAAVSAMGELPETEELGSLKSFFKKVVKTATKLSPSHQLAKALHIDKFSPSHILVNKITGSSAKSSPKTPAAAAPASVAAEPVNLPAVAQDFAAQPLPFAQNFSPSSGGGGGGAMPAAIPAEAPGETNWLMIGGIGAAGLLLLYVLMSKKKR